MTYNLKFNRIADRQWVSVNSFGNIQPWPTNHHTNPEEFKRYKKLKEYLVKEGIDVKIVFKDSHKVILSGYKTIHMGCLILKFKSDADEVSFIMLGNTLSDILHRVLNDVV